MNPFMLIKPLLTFGKPLLSIAKPLLSNPITKLIADKTVNAIEHNIEKNKIIRVKEIEGATKIDIEHIKAQKDSLKDELCVLVFLSLLIAHFVPYTQPFMSKGWEILQNADPMFWILISVVVGASMGVSGITKLKK